MSALIGREREVATALGVIATVRSTPVARSLTIEGPSGVGKTTLLAKLNEATPEWIHVTVAAHRIQSSLPFAIVRRLISTLRTSLGDVAARYTAGLGDVDSSSDPSATLLALVEGVTLDHSLVIAVDDIQWIDDESAETLMSLLAALADRPIVLIGTERIEATERRAPIEPDLRIALGPLGKREAAAVVREEYPEANDTVVNAIFVQSGGHPIDVVTLAGAARERGATTGEEVADSLRAVTVRNVQSLPSRLREFLQIVSLLNEPIDYSLLRRLWPDEKQLVDLIAQASERFLTQDGTQLHFAHALVADAVLETIPVKIPMRRRIIDALSASPSAALEDRLQIAEQAQACGDRDLAIATLTSLALGSAERGQVRLTIHVAEQLREIGEPSNESFVAFYLGYARALQFIDRLDEVIRVLEHALEETARRDLPGRGALAGQFVLALWFSDENERASKTYERFSQEFSSPVDRAALLSGGMWLAACKADVAEFERIDHELSSLAVPMSPELALRLEIVRMHMTMRAGDFPAARSAILRMEEIARTVPDALRNVGQFAEAFAEMCLLGVQESRMGELRARLRDEENGQWIDFLYGFCELLAGRSNNAQVVAESGIQNYVDPIHRKRMLSISAAIAAVQGGTSPFMRAIEADISRLLTGERGVWFMPLASWATLLADVKDSRSRVLSRIVLAHLAKPSDPFVITLATPIAVSAARRGDTELLQALQSPDALWDDRRPLVQADFRLARAIAQEASHGKAAGQLGEAIEECRNLGLAALEMLAAGLSTKKSGPKAQTPQSPLSARERQIADLVAQGKSNREIAETLVLSERTVEGHIANIFNKLNVTSRTQVAAWFLRATTA